MDGKTFYDEEWLALGLKEIFTTHLFDRLSLEKCYSLPSQNVVF